MIKNIATVNPNNEIKTDIVIVGSGPAGLNLAIKLADLGRDVIILESGGEQYSAEAQALNSGDDSRSRDRYLETSRIRTFGGTSFHWSGWCRPLDEEDFSKRAYIEHSGWPLTAEDLAPYYKSATRICELDREFFDIDKWESIRRQTQFKWPDNTFETAYFQLSPPTRFGQKYKDKISKSSKIQTYLNATVANIDLVKNGLAVDKLQVFHPSGLMVNIRASQYVIACGGIENARLLLLSNNVMKNGVGNDNDLVGRYFMDHPAFEFGAIVPENSKQNVGLYIYDSHPDFRGFGTITPSIQLNKKLESIRYNIELIPQFSGLGSYRTKAKDQYWALASRYKKEGLFKDFGDNLYRLWDLAQNQAHYHWGQVFDDSQSLERINLRFHLENTPNPQSQVMLNWKNKDQFGQPKAQLDWQINDSDFSSWHRSLHSLALACGEFGNGRLELDNDFSDGPESLQYESSWHHIGTTRMHDDPAYGVVDANCRVHNIANLYIAGSSVFPTAGHANPTLTIIALSLRLADHLKDKT